MLRAPRPFRGLLLTTLLAAPFRQVSIIRARVVLFISFLTLAGASAAGASTGAASRIRSVYGAVLNAEYFGPASGVCSHLSRSGVRSYTSGGKASCARAFIDQQRTLTTTTKNVDNTGYTPTQWQQVVSTVMANLRVKVHGKRARVTGGQSGIAGKTLVDVKGRWLFVTAPPSVGP